MNANNNMIKKVDHLVITTSNISACIDFYHGLGFTSKETGGRWELFAGDFKINVHLLGKELTPHAAHVQPGSADLCFELNQPLDTVLQRLQKENITPELQVVPRHGTYGPMQSIYLRDPDGNLVELSSYL